MCGIVGIVRAAGALSSVEDVRRAQIVGRHRGPDGEGLAFLHASSGMHSRSLEKAQPDSDIILGHRRLAILDLSPAGHQPMCTDDERLWVTYNGEIYNYLELRHELEQKGHGFRTQCDTEVLLRAYQEWGDDCVTRFNGMWAFVLVDLTRKRLLASRDRYGVKPFHYWRDKGSFAFASEIKQLLQFAQVPHQPDESILYDFLAFGALDHSERTFFADIRQLPPSHNLTLDLRTHDLQISRYYQPPTTLDLDLGKKEAASRFHDLLLDAVRLRLRSDVEVGSCLSGGLDSSSIVCLMNNLLHEQNKKELQQTFSSHFDVKEADELEYMEEVIRHTEVRSHFIRPTTDDMLRDLQDVVYHQEEPFGSTSIYAQWFVYQHVRKTKVTVMLDGQGADELMGGYLGFVHNYWEELQSQGKRRLRRWEERSHETLVAGEPWYKALLPRSRRSSAPAPSREHVPPYTEWLRADFQQTHHTSSRYLANQGTRPFGEAMHFKNATYQMSFVNNLQQLLHYADRNSMAFSVESRLPFLDYRLVDFIMTLPSHLLLRNGYRKRILRDAMEGVLPPKIQWRVSKLGFATPEALWQRTLLRDLIHEALSDSRLAAWIKPDLARQMVLAVETNGVADFTPWRIVSVYLWMQRFVCQDSRLGSLGEAVASATSTHGS